MAAKTLEDRIDTKDRLSIYAAEVVERARLGNYSHSFLMLVNQTTGETLKELHFTPYSADGSKRVSAALKPMNRLAAVADRFGLLNAFKWAADKTPLGKRLARIKGVQKTSDLHTRGDLTVADLCFIGSPAETMGRWNTACCAAIALNEADTPFIYLSRGIWKPGLNCRSGTEMALESIGLPFNALMAKGKRGIGRHLRGEIKALQEICYEGTDSPLADTVRKNAQNIRQVVFSTRPQARYRQAQNSSRSGTALAERLC